MRALFTGLYGEQIKKGNTSLAECKFDDYFDRQMQELEPRGDGASTVPFEPAPAIQFTPPSSSGTDNAVEAVPPMPGLRKG